jgi:uncharacterized membrane protein YdjX (TVP38/TMEM64 family)
MSNTSLSVLKLAILVLLVAIGIGIFQFTDLDQYLKPETLRAYIQSYGTVAPVVYVLLYCIGPVLFVPGAVLSLAGGLAFGALWGTVLTVIGATIGATLAFFVARTLGRDFVGRLLKGRLKLLDESAGRHGFTLILFLRLVPLVPFNALDYAAGLSKISARDYVLGTLIGIIPGTFAYVYLGSSLVNIYSWQFLSAILLLALMSIIPILYKKWKKFGQVVMAAVLALIGLGLSGSGSAQTSNATQVYVIDHFTEGVDASGFPKGWKPLHFKKIPRHTQYTLEQQGENVVLKAVSRASASGLYKELDLDLKAYPILSWRWRIENIIQKGDEHSKEGDDYAARVYVTFRYEPEKATIWERTMYETYRLLYGEYPPAGSLNYIWANKLAKGIAIDSVYTDRSKMIAVESGSDGVGQWITERRKVYEDYRELFGKEPPRLMAIAVMTDTDNTGESATAYYDDIVFMKPEMEDGNNEVVSDHPDPQ